MSQVSNAGVRDDGRGGWVACLKSVMLVCEMMEEVGSMSQVSNAGVRDDGRGG